MLTIREEVELRRLRDARLVSVVGLVFSIVAAVLMFALSCIPGLRSFTALAAFELFVGLLFVAFGCRARRRIRELEELDR